MFNLFNRKTPEFRDPDLDRFKELTRDPRVLDALYQFDLGVTGLPLDIAFEVQECIHLSNIITTRAQIISTQLFDAAQSGKWKHVHERLSQLQGQFDRRQVQIDAHLEKIIEWANKYEIPEMSQLDAMYYKTTGIPRNKNELMSLRFIHATNAGIEEIPSAIAYLPQIQGICLSGNEIREIPSEVCEMSTVVMLDLDENFIEIIPDNIGNMISLSQIDLDDNNVKNIPKSLLRLERLSVLRLSNQKHGHPLHYNDSPLDETSQRVLARLNSSESLRLVL